jgi:flagellar L-ring protein precursor FlgH
VRTHPLRQSPKSGFAWIALALLLAGCAAGTPLPSPPVVEAPPPAPQKAENQGLDGRREGSLWSDEGELADLFVDRKARHVGDIVTIEIVETAAASNEANTETDRESSLTAAIENFFGLEDKYVNPDNPDYKPYRDFKPFVPSGQASIKGGMSSGFEGSGATSRKGVVTATMTARVVEVLSGGNLRIVGSREVTVNHERQFITLYGVIRPRDISAGNVIESSYIADARIVYSGSGIVNDRQRPGWMSNIINNVWPF